MAHIDINVSHSECTHDDFVMLSESGKENERLFANLSPLDPLDCTSGTPTGKLNGLQQEELLLHLEKVTRPISPPCASLTLESFLPSMENLCLDPLTALHDRLGRYSHASVSTLQSHKKRVDLEVRSCKRVTISDATTLDEFFTPVLADSLDLGWWQELEDITESFPTKPKQLVISFCSSFSSKEEAYWSRFRIDPSHYDILFYEEGGKFEFHRDRISQWPFPMWDNKYTNKHSTLAPTPDLSEWKMYACIYCIDSNIDPILPDGNTEVLLPLQGFSEMHRHYTEESTWHPTRELFDNTGVPSKIAKHHMGGARKGMIHRFSEGIRPGKFVMFPSNALHRSLHVGKNKFKTALKFDIWLHNAPTAWEEFPHALTEIGREEYRKWEKKVSPNLRALGSTMFAETPPSASIDQLLGDLLNNEDYRSIKYKSVYNKRQVFDPVSDDDEYIRGLENHYPMSVPSSMTGIFRQSLSQQNDSVVSRALARCEKRCKFKVCTCKSCAPRQQALSKVGSILSKLLVSGYTRSNGLQFRPELATDVINLISEFVVGRTDSSGFICICEVREFTELGESRLSDARSCICTCPACLIRPSCRRQFNAAQYWTSEDEYSGEDDYDCNSVSSMD